MIDVQCKKLCFLEKCEYFLLLHILVCFDKIMRVLKTKLIRNIYYAVVVLYKLKYSRLDIPYVM